MDPAPPFPPSGSPPDSTGPKVPVRLIVRVVACAASVQPKTQTAENSFLRNTLNLPFAVNPLSVAESEVPIPARVVYIAAEARAAGVLRGYSVGRNCRPHRVPWR